MNFGAEEDKWAAWMRAALAGDAESYRRFLDVVTPRLRAMVHRYGYGFDSRKSDVEDLVQEALLAIHLKRGTWDQSRPLGPWLAAIVRNKVIDMLRRRGRHVVVSIDDLADVLPAPVEEVTLPTQDVDRMLTRLRGAQREIVRAISVDGSSVRETATRLNMTEGAVRVALHRALRALATAYRGET